jgi:hypothetical protein
VLFLRCIDKPSRFITTIQDRTPAIVALLRRPGAPAAQPVPPPTVIERDADRSVEIRTVWGEGQRSWISKHFKVKRKHRNSSVRIPDLQINRSGAGRYPIARRIKREREHGATLIKLSLFLTSLEVPDPNGLVERPGHQFLRPWTEGDSKRGRAMSLENVDCCTRSGIPDPHFAITCRRGDLIAICVDGNISDHALVPTASRNQFAGVGIKYVGLGPANDDNCHVITALRHRNRADIARVIGQCVRLQKTSGVGIVCAKMSVLRRDQNRSAIRRVCDVCGVRILDYHQGFGRIHVHDRNRSIATNDRDADTVGGEREPAEPKSTLV